MARIPLIAGNWKMNLNHLEAIALVQKLAFAAPVLVGTMFNAAARARRRSLCGPSCRF